MSDTPMPPITPDIPDAPPVAPANPYPTSRHPLVVFLLILCVMSGVPTVLGEVTPGSIEALLNPVFVKAWGLMLTLGPAVAIAGIMRRKLAASISLEQVGMVALGGSAITYGSAVISYNGSNGAQSGILIIVFGVFALARVWQLYRWVNKQAEIDRDTEEGKWTSRV